MGYAVHFIFPGRKHSCISVAWKQKKWRGQRWDDKLGTNGVLCWSLCCTSKQTSCRVRWAKQRTPPNPPRPKWEDLGDLSFIKIQMCCKERKKYLRTHHKVTGLMSVSQVLPSGFRVTQRNLYDDICFVMSLSYPCSHDYFSFSVCACNYFTLK